MSQYSKGYCPVTGYRIDIYCEAGTKWAVARRNSNASNWEYLLADLVWSKDHVPAFQPDEAATLRRFDAYMRACARLAPAYSHFYIYDPQAQAKFVTPTGPTVTPVLFDLNRDRIKSVCSICRETNFHLLTTPSKDVEQTIKVQCQHNPFHAYYMDLWKMKFKRPTVICPTGDILVMGTPGCLECKGTGQYVGFTGTSPCSLCEKTS